ncbi:unnamed protein product, partial [Dovyalis caffra]
MLIKAWESGVYGWLVKEVCGGYGGLSRRLVVVMATKIMSDKKDILIRTITTS